MRLKSLLACLASVFLLLFTHATARAQSPAVMDAAEMQLALKRLNVVGSVLYVGAHPDDENTALLAYLANERGVRTAYLSITRGEGGQNLIGTEQGAALGLVRTQELLAARRIDGAEQFFTSAVDFGFSKSPEEALRVWNHERVLADVVRVVRSFRPDIIITRFPTTGEGGHGHHTASAILAREAFDAAADPARFPEQLRHLKPWKPKRIVWNAFVRQGERPANADALLSLDVGAYNPLLGKSYTELAAQSRSQHKSQGMGAPERRGSALNYFAHVAGEAATKDILDGVDLTWRRMAGGEAVGRLLEEARREFQPSNPQAVVPLLLRARTELKKLAADDPLVETRGALLSRLILDSMGLWAEAVAADAYATQGAETRVAVTLVNRSDVPARFESIALPNGKSQAVGKELTNNKPVTVDLNVSTRDESLKEAAPSSTLALNARAIVGEGEQIDVPLPLLFRWTDRVQGEQYRPVVFLPKFTVRVEEKVILFPDSKPKQLHVRVRSNAAGATQGSLRVALGNGWSASPAAVPVSLKSKGEEATAVFNITPGAGATNVVLSAVFETGNESFGEDVTEIDYPHIPRQTLTTPAGARLVRAGIARRGARVGYVMGAGDEVAEALRQVGYDVTLLTDEDLAAGDFARFDAVVTGVRAYNTRAALRRTQPRLLEYVERGGTLVVQYNTPERALEGFALGPYPLKLSSERVSVEDAPVTIVEPRDALLDAPNKITAADFEGWVQERGLNFPSEWDTRYRTLFESHDPNEQPKPGGTLITRHGKGTYVYTSYSWFRQLPAGVPGAYRLFVNLVSAGKEK